MFQRGSTGIVGSHSATSRQHLSVQVLVAGVGADPRHPLSLPRVGNLEVAIRVFSEHFAVEFNQFLYVFHGRLVIQKKENKTWDLTADNVARGIHALFRR